MTTTLFIGDFAVNGSQFGYQRLPGVASNNATAPDSVALSVTGNIDIRCKVALDDWTPATEQALLSKWNTKFSFTLHVKTDGKLILYVSADGTTVASSGTSSATTGITDGAVKWVRVTRNATTGDHLFYLSDDGTAWTQLGTTVTTTASAIYDSLVSLELGSQGNVGASGWTVGKFYRAVIYSDLTETTRVFDADFATKPVGANTFTESSSNAATVTIAGSLAQAGDGRVQIVSSSAGSPATISKASGSQYVDYVSLKDSTAAGGALWYAGPHYRSVSGNSGWTFVSLLVTTATTATTGTITAAAVTVQNVTAAVATTGMVTAAAFDIQNSTATVVTTLSITAAGADTQSATATVSTIGVIVSAGVDAQFATGAIAATGTIVAAGADTQGATATLASTGTTTAAALTVDAALSTTATLATATATATLVRMAAAAVVTTGQVTAAPAAAFNATASAGIVGLLTAAVVAVHTVTSASTVVGSTTATAIAFGVGHMVITILPRPRMAVSVS
jgi:hypothetical protein